MKIRHATLKHWQVIRADRMAIQNDRPVVVMPGNGTYANFKSQVEFHFGEGAMRDLARHRSFFMERLIRDELKGEWIEVDKAKNLFFDGILDQDALMFGRALHLDNEGEEDSSIYVFVPQVIRTNMLVSFSFDKKSFQFG